MAFWQGVLLLAALGAVFILWPLFRLPISRELAVKPVRRDVTQAKLYEEHLVDLDRSLAVGDIDNGQYQALKTELQRTLVLEAKDLKEVESHGGGKGLLAVVAVVVPLVALFLYSQWGAKPDWDIYTIMKAESDTPAKSQEEYDQRSKELLIEVRSRLKQKPDNHQMRYLLAERSMAVKDYDEAIAAYKQLLEAEPGSPTMSIKLAQALFVREGNKVTAEVIHHTNVAVKGAPFMYQALEMGGMVAFHEGKYRDAITYWQRAKSQLNANSRSAQALDGAIRKAASAAIASGDDLSVSQKPSLDKAKAGDDSEAGSSASAAGFDVAVRLADSLEVAPNDTVFVYARAWRGAKMPLAIQRLKASDLPKTVRLDNSMAMAPGMDMSSAPELELIARVSKSGSPVPQSGDWQATLGPLTLSEAVKAESLVIAERVP